MLLQQPLKTTCGVGRTQHLTGPPHTLQASMQLTAMHPQPKELPEGANFVPEVLRQKLTDFDENSDRVGCTT